MVKTVTLRFNDSVFEELKAAKDKFAKKKDLSLSWEEFVMLRAGLR